MEDLTSFFCQLYDDSSLEADAAHNDLRFSCSEYFSSNPANITLTTDPMEQPLTLSELIVGSRTFLLERQWAWTISPTK